MVKYPILPASEYAQLSHAVPDMRLAGIYPVFVNDVFISHIFAPERVQIWYGGSGSGKSDTKATELLLKCLSQPFCRVLFARKFKEQIRDSQFLLFKDIIQRSGFSDFFKVKESDMDIICLANGNTLLSGGLDDVDKLKSIADITDVWIEEPMDKRGSISSSDFTEINRRLRSTKASSHIHLTFNPISKDGWIHDNFFKSNEYAARILRTTYKDNYFCPPDQERQYEILKTKKPDEYAVYALGEWGSLKQGLVFPEYELCADFPPDCIRTGYGLDWGFYPDPTALVKCGIKAGALYLDEVIYEQNLTAQTRARLMRERGVPPGAKIMADRNPEAIHDLKSLGFYNIIAATKGPGSVKAGIDVMRQFRIVVTERSRNIRRELDNYSWKAERNLEYLTGEPEDAFNHAMDAARYWVAECAHKKRGVRWG